MKHLKTSELTSRALDYAVCKAKGLDLRENPKGHWYVQVTDARGAIPPYSTNWTYGGPLVEKERLDLEYYDRDEWGSRERSKSTVNQYGSTPLQAACRAFVASVLGDTVEVPKELL
jgi:hypothetical protein